MRWICLCAFALLFAACDPYERPDIAPMHGDVWFDPPYEKRISEAEQELAAAIEAAYPALAEEVCSPDLGEALPTCELSQQCVSAAGQRVAQSLAAYHRTNSPQWALSLMELRRDSLVHVESVLPPGLEEDEIETVLMETCDGSPTPGYYERYEFLEGYYYSGGIRREMCALDWKLTQETIRMLRGTLPQLAHDNCLEIAQR